MAEARNGLARSPWMAATAGTRETALTFGLETHDTAPLTHLKKLTQLTGHGIQPEPLHKKLVA